MNRLLVNIYGLVPKTLKQSLGQSKIFKGLRQKLLYSKNGFKTAKVLVNRAYGNHLVSFNFVASIKIASKAKHVGIENTVLRNSLSLTDLYFPDRTDLCVLDVGSNFGYLASVWADSIASKGNVLAFEPNKNIYDSIQKTIASNSKFNTNFKVFNLAVGSKKETVKLNTSAFSSNTEAMSAAFESYAIDMITLDEFTIEHQISNIDLIKIDVDGIELDILKGAASILRRNQSIVIVETNEDKNIIDFFKTIDYDIYDMKLQLFEGNGVLPSNVFCVPKTLRRDAI